VLFIEIEKSILRTHEIHILLLFYCKNECLMSLDKPRRVLITEYRKVMVFIDGGYLREELLRIRDNDNWDIEYFNDHIVKVFDDYPIVGELIRTYYYDANYDLDDPLFDESTHKEKYQRNKALFEELERKENVDVKLGRLVLSSKGPQRQKGVDMLFAIDLIIKALFNQFEIAILFCGDRDFIPLVQAVKNFTGKRVYGIFFEKNCSNELRREFDRTYTIRGEAYNILGI